MHRFVQVAAAGLAGAIEHRVAAIADPDPVEAVRLARLAQSADTLRAEFGADGDDEPALVHLAATYGLDEAEVSVLAAAAAVEVDDRLAIAADQLTGATTGRLSVGLALELAGLAADSPRGVQLLDRSGRLRRHLLVDVVGAVTRLRRELVVPDRIVSHLLGAGVPDPVLGAVLQTGLAVTGPHTDAVADAVDSGAAIVWIRAGAGSAAAAEAAAAFARFGMDCTCADLGMRATDVSALDLVRLAAREAELAGCGLIVTGLPGADARGGDDAAALADQLRVLEAAVVPVVVVSPLRWQYGWTIRVPVQVEIGEPAVEQRLELWSAVTGRPAAELAALGPIRLGPQQIVSAVDLAALHPAPSPVGLDGLLGAARIVEASRDESNAMAQAIPTRLGVEDLVLPPTARADVERAIRWGRLHRSLTRHHAGPYVRSTKGTGLAMLFTGAPGTGKTLAANVIAHELGLEVMQVSLSSTVDKYIGETEKNLEKIFAAAEARDVLLFFDEADALFGSRSEVKDARDRYANQEVAYLLQRIEYFNGITVLASNYRGNLDSAFIRRIQLIVTFPSPDLPARLELWRTHLHPAQALDTADPVDLDRLASLEDLSGGDIRNISLGALYDALSVDEPLGMRHVRVAAVREFRKLGKREPAWLGEG